MYNEHAITLSCKHAKRALNGVKYVREDMTFSSSIEIVRGKKGDRYNGCAIVVTWNAMRYFFPNTGVNRLRVNRFAGQLKNNSLNRSVIR